MQCLYSTYAGVYTVDSATPIHVCVCVCACITNIATT